MTDDGRVFIFLREFDAVERLGERADLIHFDENRVRDAAVDGFAQELDVGNEEVVGDELYLCTHRVGQFFPAVPIVFRAAVFDRDDRKLLCQLLVIGNQLLDIVLRTIRFLEHILVLLCVVKLRRGHIEREEYFPAKLVARFFHRLGDGGQSVVRALEVRRETALVAHRRREAAIFQHAF